VEIPKCPTHRARSGPQLFPGIRAACALHYIDKALAEVPRGPQQDLEQFQSQGLDRCGFTEAVRGVLSHHLVIRDGKIANYHHIRPPLDASRATATGHRPPYEDSVQGQQSSKKTRRGSSKA